MKLKAAWPNWVLLVFLFTQTTPSHATPNTPPTLQIKSPNPLVLEIGTHFHAPNASASDKEDGDLTSKIVIEKQFGVNVHEIGTYQVKYYVEDSKGAIGQETLNVRVQDTRPPIITLKGNNPFPLELDTHFKEPGAIAKDLVDGDISSAVEDNTSHILNIHSEGDYIVTYEVRDKAGNLARVTRTIQVRDLKPIITIRGENPLKWPQKKPFQPPQATAKDVEGNEISKENITVSLNGLKVETERANFNITYEVKDSKGRKAEENLQVQIVNTPPTLEILGPDKIELELDEPFHPKLQMQDIQDEQSELRLMSEVFSGPDLHLNAPGEYVLKYTVFDSGNLASNSVTVNVKKWGERPTINLLGDNPLEMEAGQNYLDKEPGFKAFDSRGNDIHDKVNIGIFGINTTVPGKYQVTYDVKDPTAEHIEAIQQIRTVIITKAKPEIKLTGSNPVVLEAGHSYKEEGAIATDPLGKDISASIVIVGTPNTKIPGTYKITYDFLGTEKIATHHETRTVKIIDTTPPILTLNGSKSILWEKGRPYKEPGATATDIVDGDISYLIASTPQAVNTDSEGDYDVKYFVTDSSNNQSAANRKVKVVSIPLIELEGDAEMVVQVGQDYVEPGVKVKNSNGHVDNALAKAIRITPPKIDTLKPGQHTIRYDITESGNRHAMSKYRMVTVLDSAPIAQDKASFVNEPNERGKVKIRITSLGLGMGAIWGEGVLYFKEEEFPFTLSGLSLANVGLSTSEISGEVQNLSTPENFEGEYWALQLGITVGGGFYHTGMVNTQNVRLSLSGFPRGLAVHAGINGVTVKLIR